MMLPWNGLPTGSGYRDQLISLLQTQRTDTCLSGRIDFCQSQTLYRTIPGHHHQILILTEFPQPDQPDAEVSIPTPQPRRGLVSDEEQKALQSERRRNALRSQLDAAVREERYEDAARLRDELRSLPQE